MSSLLNLKYSVTFTGTTKVIDVNNEMSSEDTTQQKVSLNTNAIEDGGVHKLEVPLLPTPYATPSASRIYDINTESFQAGFLRSIYIKSESQFLYSVADTANNLITAPRTLARLYSIDRGTMVTPSAFTPDQPYPKYIRLMNPLEVNGGGDGNSTTDTPILVSVFIVVTPATL